ncbi:hypothetical protein [Roseibium aestuarii]|uniref:Uncharacterized protein n=1 Tax=Roseibium aestuarii TaxID=2600299 RepID=A0ABW4JT08_9HYPH|nr:hypothetical protein [Roseibium aestuarii]
MSVVILDLIGDPAFEMHGNMGQGWLTDPGSPLRCVRGDDGGRGEGSVPVASGGHALEQLLASARLRPSTRPIPTIVIPALSRDR